MNPFRKFTLTLSMLALLALNAYAFKCNLTVNVELPTSGWNNLYVVVDGASASVTNSTKEGKWTKFDISGYGSQYVETFFLSSKNNDWNANAIGKLTWDAKIDQGTNNSGLFSCADAKGGNVIYISASPTTGRPVIATEPPNAFYFYFLPPNDEEWIKGAPHIRYADGSTKAMEATEKCGWYKIVFFNQNPPVPEEGLLVQLGTDGAERIGYNGIWEENPTPTPIRLDQIFNGIPGERYFMADQGEDGWSSTDPNIIENNRCSFKMAAIIYDSDWIAEPCAFKDGTYQAEKYPGCSPTPTGVSVTANGGATGIARGIPKPDLVKDADGISKMVFNKSADGWSKESFDRAFRKSPGKNVQVCYDMPFYRTEEGLWEFDSDKLCANGEIDPEGKCGTTRNDAGVPSNGAGTKYSGYMGGFFPPELNRLNTADYTSCPSCKETRLAEPWVPILATVNKWCFDRGYGSGEGFPAVTSSPLSPDGTRCGRAFTDGDFRDGTHPEVWDWGKRAVFGSHDNIVGRNTAGSTATMNELFCFESHAEFTYTAGQEFFFRGDDDIWIFINNKLVIDLGGSHLAAPGYVSLSTLQLTEGQTYPIDIFFCDSRITMSNVRITSNIYFSQKPNFIVDPKNPTTPGKALTEFCFQDDGGGDCSAIFSNSKGGELLCGCEIRDEVTISLERGGKTEILDEKNPNCSVSGKNLVCYGGIIIDECKRLSTGGSMTVNENMTAIVEHAKSTGAPKRYPIKKAGTPVKVVWGNVVSQAGGNTIYNLVDNDKGFVTGKRVPIGFAAGDWEGTRFIADSDKAADGGGVGMAVVINQSSLRDPKVSNSGLIFYKDSSSTTPIKDFGDLVIPDNGVLRLWVTGTYDADGDAEYSINTANGEADKPLRIKFYVPRLAFIDPATAENAVPTKWEGDAAKGTDLSKTGGPKDKWGYVAETQDRIVAAYDVSVSPEVLCTTCEFKLNYRAASTPDIGGSELIDFNPLELKEGIGRLSFAGLEPTFKGSHPNDDPNASYVTLWVRGPSINEDAMAKWDELYFKELPTPYPELVEIFDRDGDGIGDSLRITYNKEFRSGGTYFSTENGVPGDLLPNYIEILWDSKIKDVIGFGPKTQKSDKSTTLGYEYNGDGVSAEAKISFWESMLEGNSTIVIKDINLSEGIKTATYEGNNVRSWASFTENNIKSTVGSIKIIGDKIPAIVVSARYRGQENCGDNISNRCTDAITLELSEPVVALDNDVNEDAIKTAFAYLLRSHGETGPENFKVYRDADDIATRMTWRTSNSTKPPAAGDSVAYLTYRSYKDYVNNRFSLTPEGGDSVKFDYSVEPYFALMDLKGNTPNPREQGKPIIGSNRTTTGRVSIAEADPEKNTVKECINSGICPAGYEPHPGLDLSGKGLFDKSHVEILPIPETWRHDSLVRKYYPGSVGMTIRPDIYSVVDSLEKAHNIKIPAENIELNATAIYHTNLGNFVVEQKIPSVNCGSDIFKINGEGDCRSNPDGKSGIYIAWDLKDKKNRTVGAGAYVGIHDFYWTAKISEGNIVKFDNKSRKIEMYGVKRKR